MSSVGIELVNEIERVSAKRERWRDYAKNIRAAANFNFAIAMMTAAIGEAKEALNGDDPARAIRAYENLKGFDSDD